MLDVKNVDHDNYDSFKKRTTSPCHRDHDHDHHVQALRESEEEARLREEGVDDVESIGVDPLDERY